MASSSTSLLSYALVFFTVFYLTIPMMGLVFSKGLMIDIMDEGRFITSPLAEVSRVLTNAAGFDLFKWIGLAVTLGVSLSLARFVAMKTLRTPFLSLSSQVLTQSPAGVLISLVVMAEFAFLASIWGDTEIAAERSLVRIPPIIELPNTHALGQYVYTEYIYVFQTAGMILLVAMIAAIVLTQRVRTGVKRQNIYEQNNRRVEDAVELVKIKPGQGLGKWK